MQTLAAACAVLFMQLAPETRPLFPAESQPERQASAVIGGSEIWDAGTLEVGAMAVCRRTVENRGATPLRLRAALSSCPCVKVECDPPEVPANTVSTVTMKAPVAAVGGRQVHWAKLDVLAPNERGEFVPQQRFGMEVRYEANLAFIVKPDSIWITVPVGMSFARTVYLRSRVMSALNAHEFRVSDEHLGVAVRRFAVPTNMRENEEALALTVTGAFPSPGLIESELTFATDDPKFLNARVPMHIRVLDRWVADPAGFAFILTPSQDSQELRVQVSSRDGSACPAVRAELQGEDGRPVTMPGVRLRIDPGTRSNTVTAVATLDVKSLTASAGVASVALFDSESKLVRRLPLAWVGPVTGAARQPK